MIRHVCNLDQRWAQLIKKGNVKSDNARENHENALTDVNISF